MNICYVINNNKKFVDILKVSIASVLEYNVRKIKFYILYDGLNKKDKDSIELVTNNTNSEIYFIDVSSYINVIHLNTGWPNIVNVRLFLRELLPNDVEKILYLDSDTLVLDVLDNLYNTDIGDKSIAVVEDTVKDTFKEKLGLKKDDVYFNSGVILINVKRFSKFLNITTINEIIEKYGKNIRYPDQDLLNCCFIKYNEYILLPLKYNVLPPYFMFEYRWLIKYKNCKYWKYKEGEYRSSIENPSIVHFAGSFCYARPWAKKCQHPYAIKFREISNKINTDNFIYKDDRNLRQRMQSFFFRCFPNNIIMPLICRGKRLYEKRNKK